MKHSNCTWHKFLSILREAAKMHRVSLAKKEEEEEKNQMVPSPIKQIIFMDVKLDLKRRVMPTWGVCCNS